MRQIRLLFVVVVLAFLGTNVATAGETWGVPKKVNIGSDFDTKGIKQLLKEIDQINEEFELATAEFWGATELFQSVIEPYTDGKMPILSQNWALVLENLGKAKSEVEKKAALDLRKGYVREMEDRKKFVEGIMQDPEGTLKLKTSLNTDDLDKLTKIPGMLKKVVDMDTRVAGKLGETAKKIPDQVANLTKQIAKDPLKAADYKDLVGKLEKGKSKLDEIPEEAGRQTKAADSMSSSVTRLIEKQAEKIVE